MKLVKLKREYSFLYPNSFLIVKDENWSNGETGFLDVLKKSIIDGCELILTEDSDDLSDITVNNIEDLFIIKEIPDYTGDMIITILGFDNSGFFQSY